MNKRNTQANAGHTGTRQPRLTVAGLGSSRNRHCQRDAWKLDLDFEIVSKSNFNTFLTKDKGVLNIQV